MSRQTDRRVEIGPWLWALIFAVTLVSIMGALGCVLVGQWSRASDAATIALFGGIISYEHRP